MRTSNHFVVEGLYTDYADFIYKPKHAGDQSARIKAYDGMRDWLQLACDFATYAPAKVIIQLEMIHFMDQRRNIRNVGPTKKLRVKDDRIEAEIFDAMFKAQGKFRYTRNFPQKPDSNIRYRCDERDAPPKRRDSAVEEKGPPPPAGPAHHRAKTLHNVPKGSNCNKLWEQKRARRAAIIRARRAAAN